MIPFNKPYLTGKEAEYINDAVQTGKISGNGKYTQKCQNFKFYGKWTLWTFLIGLDTFWCTVH